MDDTAEQDELTEFEMIEVKSIKAVPMGANGFPHLIMKGMPPGTEAAAAGELAGAPRPFAGQVAQPPHMPLKGRHVHVHEAHGGPDDNGDGLHIHIHEHDNDADHDHDHPAGDEDSALQHAAGALVKAVVNGGIDQAPDVALGQQILHLLGQAMINEAQEVSAGAYGETCDVALLTRAADMVSRWCAGEQGGCGCCGMCTGPGCGCCWDCPGTVMQSAAVKGGWQYGALTDEAAKAPREFSEAERKKHASAGHALPDGSYPVPDKDALRRAAILARSKHGNWQAAERLIARRAKELGVPNPLTENDDGKNAGKSALAEGETAVDTEPQGNGEAVAKAVADAVTKALKPIRDELEALRVFKAKVEKLPVPGGPVLSAAARPAGVMTAEAEDYAAKAALYRAKADAATTPADRDGYRQLAREADEKAAKITA